MRCFGFQLWVHFGLVRCSRTGFTNASLCLDLLGPSWHLWQSLLFGLTGFLRLVQCRVERIPKRLHLLTTVGQSRPVLEVHRGPQIIPKDLISERDPGLHVPTQGFFQVKCLTPWLGRQDRQQYGTFEKPRWPGP